jgi:hypothetical protein
MSSAVPEVVEKVEPPPAPPEPPFSATERAAFQDEDRRLAASVVCIMLTIFVAAVIGYAYICMVAYETRWP